MTNALIIIRVFVPYFPLLLKKADVTLLKEIAPIKRSRKTPRATSNNAYGAKVSINRRIIIPKIVENTAPISMGFE